MDMRSPKAATSVPKGGSLTDPIFMTRRFVLGDAGLRCFERLVW